MYDHIPDKVCQSRIYWCASGLLDIDCVYDVASSNSLYNRRLVSHKQFHKVHRHNIASKSTQSRRLSCLYNARRWRDQYDSEPSIRRQGGHLAPRMTSKGLSSMRDTRFDKAQCYKEVVCYICDGSLIRRPRIMQHPVCYHEFHEACFVRYARGKPSCPRCGSVLYESLKSELTNDIGKKY